MTYRFYGVVFTALLACAACAAQVSAQNSTAPATSSAPAAAATPAAPAAPVAPAAPAPASSAPALFTTAQAEQGAKLYTAQCAACHGANLEGVVGPALAGNDFRTLAAGQKLNPKSLLEVIATTMPMTAPASLKPAEYAAITAYILQKGGYSAGDKALAKDNAGLDAVNLGVDPKAPAGQQAAAAAAPAAPAAAQILASSGVYTAAQAQHGRQLYNETCIACHGGELDGVEDAPPLAGGLFMSKWGNLPVNALHAFIDRNMPQGNGGALGPVGGSDVVALILQKNGFPAGSTPLPADPKSLSNILLK